MAQKVRIPKNHPVKARLIKFLSISGVYDDSYNETVDLYVETYDFYQKMRKELEAGELLVEFTNKAGATNHVKNPLAIEITKTVQTLNNLLKSMGLTPAQRKLLDSSESRDELEEFINS